MYFLKLCTLLCAGAGTGDVEQLGAEDFRLREQAEARLTRLGVLALPALHNGSTSEDAEIRMRCRRLTGDVDARLSRVELSLRAVWYLTQPGIEPGAWLPPNCVAEFKRGGEPLWWAIVDLSNAAGLCSDGGIAIIQCRGWNPADVDVPLSMVGYTNIMRQRLRGTPPGCGECWP